MEITIPQEMILEILRVGRTAVIIIAFLAIVYNWEKIEGFASSVVEIFRNIYKSGATEVSRMSLQADINRGVIEIEKEVPGLFDNAVKVQWLKSGNEHANVKKRGVYVRVKEAQNQDELLLNTLSHLYEKAFLVKAKNYIHGHIFESIKLVLTEKILANSRFRSAIVSFREEQYNPSISSDKKIKETVNKLEFLDFRGLFTRVYLNECKELPKAVGIGHESSKPRWDLTNFLDYLMDLFTTLGEKEARVNFEYSSQTINVAFAVIADEYTWVTKGINFYQRRTKVSIQRGASSIYLIALGKRNVKAANNLGIWLKKQNYISTRKVSYFDLSVGSKSNVPSTCIRCDVNKHALDIIAEEKDDDLLVNDSKLHESIRLIVQEPEFEIVKSAWLKGYQAQVVVHSTNPQKHVMAMCVGKNGVIGKEINDTVGDYVRFIEWNSDIRKAIINNLDNHDEEDINNVIIEPSHREAFVFVNSRSAIHNLSGPSDKTLQLAEVLTDYSIEILETPKSKWIGQLTNAIPEIQNGDIEIEDLVIFAEKEIRVLVSSNKHGSPGAVCARYLTTISNFLEGNERIYFCNKHDNINDSIIAALYPLRYKEVVKIVENSPSKYTVFVRDSGTLAKAVGTEGAHVRAASDLLGIWIEFEISS